MIIVPKVSYYVALAVGAFCTYQGYKLGVNHEHAQRVKDEVAALVQVNEEQHSTIVAMDERYKSIVGELDIAVAENTRLAQLAQAKKGRVEHAISESKDWGDGAVPADVASSLRDYAGSDENGDSANSTGASINIQRGGDPTL